MCGFSGLYTTSLESSESELRELAQNMSAEIIHRGRDGSGVWSDKFFAVAHNRLAIQDLSFTGNQPMVSQDTRFVLAYNGEIYNYSLLKARVEQLAPSCAWRGNSDTEFLLEHISFFGLMETLEIVDGMFAFSLWDRRENTLFLCRDRFGEKPLYWGIIDNSIVFASELRAIETHPGFIPKVSSTARNEYFRLSCIHAPYSIYESIYKIEPGTVLVVRGAVPACAPKAPIQRDSYYQNIAIKSYCGLPGHSVANVSDGSLGSLSIDRLESVIEDSVVKRMSADVPVGSFLSGGIDSSLITALMQKNSSSPVDTFSLGFYQQDYDEAPAARKIAGHLGCNHHEYYFGEESILPVVEKIPEIYDEPFADSSQVPTIFLAGLAKKSVSVVLSGDGGDEVFCGYPRYLLADTRLRIRQSLPLLAKKMASNLALPLISFVDQRTNGALYSNCLSVKYRRFLISVLIDHSIELVNDYYLSAWQFPESLFCEDLPGLHADYEVRSPPCSSFLNELMVHDLNKYLPGDLLCKVDRASMHFGLEVRSPFLSGKLLEETFMIPAEQMLRNGQLKFQLRQMLEKYLPREYFDRPKKGFSLPLSDLLRGPMKAIVDYYFTPSKLQGCGLLNFSLICRAWALHLGGKKDYSTRLWVVLLYQIWFYSRKKVPVL